jgi:hypothetical protein
MNTPIPPYPFINLTPEQLEMIKPILQAAIDRAQAEIMAEIQKIPELAATGGIQFPPNTRLN